MPRRLELTGKPYGRLTVQKHAGTSEHGKSLWECLCQCGKTVVVDARGLVSGKVLSCGCLRNERARTNGLLGGKPIRHGHAQRGTSEYHAWKTMKQRCGPHSRGKDRELYYLRGVRVHPEWAASFEAFLAHIGPKPSPTHSIDRYPNRDGNYEPGNVRWATPKEQANNRRPRRSRAA